MTPQSEKGSKYLDRARKKEDLRNAYVNNMETNKRNSNLSGLTSNKSKPSVASNDCRDQQSKSPNSSPYTKYDNSKNTPKKTQRNLSNVIIVDKNQKEINDKYIINKKSKILFEQNQLESAIVKGKHLKVTSKFEFIKKVRFIKFIHESGKHITQWSKD